LSLQELQEFHAGEAPEVDPGDRIRQLEGLMQVDINKYHESGAAEELLRLRRDEGWAEEPAPDAGADVAGDEAWEAQAEASDSDITLEDLNLLSADADVALDEGDEDRPVLAARVEHTAPTDDAELEDWRADRGIPQSADQYELAEHDWTEQDQPLLNEFRETAHSANVSNDQFLALQEAYARQQAASRAEIEEINDTALGDAQAALEEVYGEEAPAVIDATKAYLDHLPDGLGSQLRQARFADGRLLFNDPLIAQMFAAMAVAEGTEAAPSGQQQSGQSSRADLVNEAADLERLMVTKIDEYLNAPWRRTGKTGSERLLDINRQLAGERR
jgi:hypothetical protein